MTGVNFVKDAKIDPTQPLRECSICLSQPTAESERWGHLTHIFHRACIENWLTVSPTCPDCRAQVINWREIAPPSTSPPSTSLANYVAGAALITIFFRDKLWNVIEPLCPPPRAWLESTTWLPWWYQDLTPMQALCEGLENGTLPYYQEIEISPYIIGALSLAALALQWRRLTGRSY